MSLQEGSLEQAVTAARRKNLALSASVLLILGVSVLLTIMASRRAQRLERQHVDFVAGVSHELRSPLASIRSAAQNLADGVVQKPEQVERYGQLLDRESRRLGAMVEQVLAYAGVRSETAELKFEAVDVKGLLETALADCQWLLEERGVEPDLRVDEGLPEIWGDADRLRRSLVNLIDNAAKYGAEGGWVRVGALWRSEQQRVELFVEDDGPGFDPALRHRLCDPFVRGGASNIPGSGLGLSLVSKIAELHGAELSLTSSEGGGAKVELRLAPISEKGPDETEDRG